MKEAEEESLVRMAFDAYVRKDRTMIESLLSDNFHFTSPYDDHIDRDEYFERCWPGSKDVDHIDVLAVGLSDEEALAHYEVFMKDGSHFKNVDTFTIRDGMIIEQETYFGDPPKGMDRDEFSHLSH